MLSGLPEILVNVAHAQTVDTRLPLSLGTRLIGSLLIILYYIYIIYLLSHACIFLYILVAAPTTCLALQQIAADASEELSCNTNGNEDCDTVVCTTDIMGLPLVTEFNVLSCNDPPAIAVIIMGGSSVIFDGVLTESQEIALFSSKLDITLDQLHNAIGLEVYN